MDPDEEPFVVHIAFFSLGSRVAIYLAREVQIAVLNIEKVIVPPEYSDYANIFSENSAAKLPNHTGINDHPIDLVDDKQLPYSPIYILGPVELKTLKTYNKTNLANSFIRPSQSSAGAPILFIKKKDGSLWLCVNY